MELLYKIRRRSDGYFSMGGMEPRFTRDGKIWKKPGHLKNHLALMLEPGSNPTLYDDCEVVVFEVVERVVGSKPVSEYLEERKAAKKQAEKERQLEWEEYHRQQRLTQYRELQKEFG